MRRGGGPVVMIDGTQLTVAPGPFITLGMPGMTMTFPVVDQSLLDGLKVGAQIRFGIRERDEGMVVEQIKVLEGQP